MTMGRGELSMVSRLAASMLVVTDSIYRSISRFRMLRLRRR